MGRFTHSLALMDEMQLPARRSCPACALNRLTQEVDHIWIPVVLAGSISTTFPENRLNRFRKRSLSPRILARCWRLYGGRPGQG